MYPTLEAALEYAALGFRVLPLKPLSKIPDLRHWPEEASNNAATVRRHFADSQRRAGHPHDYPNVGIATGYGLAVLDIDENHGGERPSWAVPTLEASTPSGGAHLYYAVSRDVPNSVGRLAPGVDVRGTRGQVVAAPSALATGRRPVNDTMFEEWISPYAWVNSEPIAEIDPDLLIPADMRVEFAGLRTPRGFEFRDAVPVGERNNYLTSCAGWLFNQGEPDVLTELQAESDRLGFTPRKGELAAIVRSVSRYHR